MYKQKLTSYPVSVELLYDLNKRPFDSNEMSQHINKTSALQPFAVVLIYFKFYTSMRHVLVYILNILVQGVDHGVHRAGIHVSFSPHMSSMASHRYSALVA